jgi:hypothetical protein
LIEDGVCIRKVRIIRREKNHNGRRNRQDCPGAIWDALNTKGELSLGELKKAVKGKEPTFDWAIGWLARENQIAIAPEKRSFRIRLKQEQANATGASQVDCFPWGKQR